MLQSVRVELTNPLAINLLRDLEKINAIRLVEDEIPASHQAYILKEIENNDPATFVAWSEIKKKKHPITQKEKLFQTFKRMESVEMFKEIEKPSIWQKKQRNGIPDY